MAHASSLPAAQERLLVTQPVLTSTKTPNIVVVATSHARKVNVALPVNVSPAVQAEPQPYVVQAASTSKPTGTIAVPATTNAKTDRFASQANVSCPAPRQPLSADSTDERHVAPEPAATTLVWRPKPIVVIVGPAISPAREAPSALVEDAS